MSCPLENYNCTMSCFTWCWHTLTILLQHWVYLCPNPPSPPPPPHTHFKSASATLAYDQQSGLDLQNGQFLCRRQCQWRRQMENTNHFTMYMGNKSNYISSTPHKHLSMNTTHRSIHCGKHTRFMACHTATRSSHTVHSLLSREVE